MMSISVRLSDPVEIIERLNSLHYRSAPESEFRSACEELASSRLLRSLRNTTVLSLHGMATPPRGINTYAAGCLERWLPRQFAAGRSAHEIYDMIARDVADPRFEVMDYRVLTALTVIGRVEITPAAALVNCRKIPGGIPSIDFNGYMDFCVLEQSLTVDPIVRPKNGVLLNGKNGIESQFTVQDDLEELIIEASCLTDQSWPVAKVLHFHRVIGDPLFCFQPKLSEMSINPGTLYNDADRSSEILNYARMIQSFEQNLQIRRIIKRLYKYKFWPPFLESILDFGICLESLFLSSGAGQNGEIGLSLRIRAGWLLGDTLEKRLEIADTVQQLYNFRSQAAHDGQFKKNGPTTDEMNRYYEILRDSIRKMITIGRFPDWKAVIFGGDVSKI